MATETVISDIFTTSAPVVKAESIKIQSHMMSSIRCVCRVLPVEKHEGEMMAMALFGPCYVVLAVNYTESKSGSKGSTTSGFMTRPMKRMDPTRKTHMVNSIVINVQKYAAFPKVTQPRHVQWFKRP